jgi:hypothetical protein
MQHPLESVPNDYRKRLFFALLIPTLILSVLFEIWDQPLKVPGINGILSFELAGSPLRAMEIIDSWKQASLALSNTGQANPDIVNVPYLFASFGLGIDYLFMLTYAFALGFGTLLAANRHEGWLKSLGAVAGYGAFVAACFDGVENYALFQILSGKVFSPYPEIAFYCASIKFGFLILVLLYTIVAGVLPKTK